MGSPLPLAAWLRAVRETDPVRVVGRVVQVVGLVAEARGPRVHVGEWCTVQTAEGELPAEVVGFRQDRFLMMPLGPLGGLAPGSAVVPSGRAMRVPAGRSLLGRVTDGLGRPLDGRPLEVDEWRLVHADPPNPLQRPRITEPLPTGVRAIDGLLTLGRGQRVGIFAGSGVGKSTLLGMVARHSAADANVIALVGERGREVLDFLENDLGEGLERSVVVVATSDQPPLVRARAPFVATAIAEAFRDQGMHVMLMMDSATRFCMAQREIGLAVGEPPTSRGYTPSVFALLPQLMERAGTAPRGSITALYTVLVEGDDLMEPVADHARSILDGHIVLSRSLAAQGHYPPVDVLESTSRLMASVVDPDHLRWAQAVRAHLATYREVEDLVNLGAYVRGSNPRVDAALDRIEEIRMFLRQMPHERADFATTRRQLAHLAGEP
ncbi:putative ATP synthase YscN [bacterium HR32]|nr:putative ATP synthase YscN [bacterium HR32]